MTTATATDYRRIVSICPSNTEILYALGLADRLVGVDNSSDYPPAARKLPRVGHDNQVDIGKVAALEPDLVIAALSVPGMERNIAGLEVRGLPYIVLKPTSLPEIWADIRTVGRVCGAEERAEALIARLDARIARIRERVASAPHRPRLYWEWWQKPLIVPGRVSWIQEMAEIVGAEHVFGDLDAESAPVAEAEVLRRDPELVVLSWCGAKTLIAPEKIRRQRTSWAATSAFREGRLYVVDESGFGRPGPRLVDGLELMAHLVHPDRFPERPTAIPVK